MPKPIAATFPKIFKAPTQLRTTQSDNGVGALDRPVHSSAFEAGTDDHLAASLEDTGGGTQALGMKLRITHASPIAEDVQRAFSGFRASLSLAAELMNHVTQSTLIQLRATLFRPWFACLRGGENRMGDAIQSFFGMITI